MIPMKNRPINYGRSDLRTMIEKNYRYIDKTESIYKLISSPIDCAFLSRPRRFGKSLLIDTLSEIFQGNKELFKGLAIYKKKYSWDSYPVIRIDMTDIDRGSRKKLEASLCETIRQIAKDIGIDIRSLTKIVTPKSYLSALLKNIKKSGKEAVVLIDEYDYPILSNIGIKSSKFIQDILEALKDFYLSFKSNNSCIHFLLLTGVTRISKTSIFSGINNLEDISWDPRFSDLLGYTQKELEFNFSNEIAKIVSDLGVSKKNFLDKVKEWYDGYRFSDKTETVYNPADINLFFSKGSRFVSYWVDTETSSFLVNLLSGISYFDIEKELFSSKDLTFFTSNLDVLGLHHLDDMDNVENRENLIRLFYQTGYLTIKSFDSENDLYYLGFPNREVNLAFSSYIVKNVWNKTYSYLFKYKKLGTFLIEKDMESFISCVKDLFDSFTKVPQKYHENTVQMLLSLVLRMTEKLRVEEQVHAGDGVADIVVETKGTIYIMELKIDKKASTAINQIKKKRYTDKYLLDPKYKKVKVIGIGLCFSSSKCRLVDSKWEEFSK